ncbi:MAG: hypothetical protein U5O39_09205 [Gammaproteobacteria bacterium]|nr:hypothetical protein [Gammaproteobacteria bacterium]
MNRGNLIVAFSLFLSGCASVGPPSSSERLLAEPPAQWQRVYQFNNRKTRLSEFVPAGQTAEQWEIKLTLESHTDLAEIDPIELIEAEIERLQENCTFVQHFNLFSGLENGYPSSARLALCGESRPVEKGEVRLMKAIQANDYMYLLNVTRRIPPFEISSPAIPEQEVGWWADYLSNVRVCDPARESHPCPASD